LSVHCNNMSIITVLEFEVESMIPWTVDEPKQLTVTVNLTFS
jgi:hypothetical protein